MIAKFLAALVSLTCVIGVPRAVAQAGSELIEDGARLAVTIDGRSYALDALVVRRPGTDKLPVALITHGSAPGDPHAATIDWIGGWARDLAHRGWLAVAVMRRGYGKSDGVVANNDGNCAAPDVGRYLDTHADDLEAALQVIAQRPDADTSRVLGIGDSAGGAAVLALAARPQVRLSAVINVSGGLGRQTEAFHPAPGCTLYQSDLVWNLARFGTTARMPTLWLYAENDGFFRPGLIGRMRSAFTASGGKAELVMLPPFGSDGHRLFFTSSGRQLLLPAIDGFLRANGLPTWDDAIVAPFLARVPPADRSQIVAYLSLPSEKALAASASLRLYWHFGDRTVEDARTGVLAYCKSETKADCALVAQDFEVVGTGSAPLQAQPTDR